MPREIFSSTELEAEHLLDVDDKLPAGQLHPAVQGPVQFDDVSPADEPYLPEAHGPLQLSVDNPLVEPYRPASHNVQSPAPPKL